MDWTGNVEKLRDLVRDTRKVIFSDIEFCDPRYRRRIEEEIGVAVHWICLKNEPWQCAKNCLHRFMREGVKRPLETEIEAIKRLTKIYTLTADVRPVSVADAES